MSNQLVYKYTKSTSNHLWWNKIVNGKHKMCLRTYPKTIDEAIEFSRKRFEMVGIKQIVGTTTQVGIIYRVDLQVARRYKDVMTQLDSYKILPDVLIVECLTLGKLMADPVLLRDLRSSGTLFGSSFARNWKPKEVWLSSFVGEDDGCPLTRATSFELQHQYD